MRSWHRYTAIEYAPPRALAREVARTSGVSVKQAQELLLGAADRVRGLLGLTAIPIILRGELVQFRNFAGLLVLAQGMELEVAPKFLGSASGWREDFFLLATLSHHGRLLDSEGLKSASRQTSDLATLIGRSLVEMYWREQRRPLRTYRRLSERMFALEGEFEPEELLSREEDGFIQVVTSLTRLNPYNAIIRSAAEQLSQVVSGGETRVRLERVSHHLPRQALPARRTRRRLPSRLYAWQSTYDLSLDILRGLGGSYDPKNALAPGFVMLTWQVWEYLITIGLCSGFGGQNVSIQPKRRLGTRYVNGRYSSLDVFPDAVVQVSTSECKRLVIVDAKYKGHTGEVSLSVSNADIYEVLAFSRASSIKDAVLIYPCVFNPDDPSKSDVGGAYEFSRIDVDDVTIRAIEVGVSGIAGRGGLKRFVTALARSIP